MKLFTVVDSDTLDMIGPEVSTAANSIPTYPILSYPIIPPFLLNCSCYPDTRLQIFILNTVRIHYHLFLLQMTRGQLQSIGSLFHKLDFQGRGEVGSAELRAWFSELNDSLDESVYMKSLFKVIKPRRDQRLDSQEFICTIERYRFPVPLASTPLTQCMYTISSLYVK